MRRPSGLIFFVFIAVCLTMQASFAKDLNLENYLASQEALAADHLKDAQAAARALSASATGAIKTRATAVAKAPNLEKARAEFKTLSDAMLQWAKKTKPAGIKAFHCPMADGDWLQKEGEVHNPYFGKNMLSCGEAVPLK